MFKMEVRYVWIAMAAAKYSENINTGDVTRFDLY